MRQVSESEKGRSGDSFVWCSSWNLKGCGEKMNGLESSRLINIKLKVAQENVKRSMSLYQCMLGAGTPSPTHLIILCIFENIFRLLCCQLLLFGGV